MLWDLSWPELKAVLPAVKVALIGVGSTEQHGPNMTFEADTARAYEFCRRLGARLYPHALVAPAIPFGLSAHHMNFPGTITLRPETFAALVSDVVESLVRHGLTRFFLVNAHGGNRPALSLLVNSLHEELGIDVAWTSFTSLAADVLRARVTSPVHGHACEGEVAQGLYLAPRTVKTAALAAGQLRTTGGHWPGIETARRFDELTANGALGDATQASTELGAAIIETALERAEAFVRQFAGIGEV